MSYQRSVGYERRIQRGDAVDVTDRRRAVNFLIPRGLKRIIRPTHLQEWRQAKIRSAFEVGDEAQRLKQTSEPEGLRQQTRVHDPVGQTGVHKWREPGHRAVKVIEPVNANPARAESMASWVDGYGHSNRSRIVQDAIPERQSQIQVGIAQFVIPALRQAGNRRSDEKDRNSDVHAHVLVKVISN